MCNIVVVSSVLNVGCVNNDVPIGSIASYFTTIPIKSLPAPSIANISCFKPPLPYPENRFLCDLLTVDTRIITVNLSLSIASPTQISATVTNLGEDVYYKFADTYATSIFSSADYFVFTGSSYIYSLGRAMLYKRIYSGGSKYTAFSLDLTPLASQSMRASIDKMEAFVYQHPTQVGNPYKLMASDFTNRSLAKIYSVSPMQLTLSSTIGNTEMERLRSVYLLFNRQLPMFTNTTIYSILFSPITLNRDTRDATSTNIFSDYVGWWVTLIIVLVLLLIPIGIYYIRREKLKKYTS
jgi:hypothetical protein